MVTIEMSVQAAMQAEAALEERVKMLREHASKADDETILGSVVHTGYRHAAVALRSLRESLYRDDEIDAEWDARKAELDEMQRQDMADTNGPTPQLAAYQADSR